MTINERIREVRIAQNMTMEKFGGRLGVGKTAISNIENGNRNVTDQMAVSICREFDINEEWLRDGTGEMFTPLTRSETISKFAGGLMKESDESFKKQLVEVLAELDESEWEVLEGIAKKLAKKD